jgi:transketolase C-terminal domain/subunit
MDLRKQFFEKMEIEMENDPDVVFITFDLGYGFSENLQKRFPDRFINAGCIECAGTGIGAGMAIAGKNHIYTLGAIFITMRNYEF